MTHEEMKIGMAVTYIPAHARQSERHPDRELGKVKSWNDTYAFVDYGTGTAKATRYEDLQAGNQTFVCHDESNSVLHGAFGRCESECFNCKNLRTFMENLSKKPTTHDQQN